MYAEKISEDLADYLCGICEMYGFELMPDYSGRFMYGDKCLGIVIDGTIGTLISALLEGLTEDNFDLKDEIAEMFSSLKMDNMGLSYIYYFPGYQIENDEQ